MPRKRASSDIGQRLGRLRQEVGLSARELDRLAGITEGHTSLLESVVRNVSVQTLFRVSKVLGVTLDWLVGGEGKEPSTRTVRASIEAARAEYLKI